MRELSDRLGHFGRIADIHLAQPCLPPVGAHFCSGQSGAIEIVSKRNDHIRAFRGKDLCSRGADAAGAPGDQNCFFAQM